MKCLGSLVPVLFFLAIGTATEPTKKAPSVADELQRFQGTWPIESWEEGGKALAPADLKKRSVFFGGNIFVLRRDGKVYQAGATQLDPAKSPRTINLSLKEGEGKDGVMLGIYSFEGDTLKLCFDPQGQTRPESFKLEPKSDFTLITLKKPKVPADEAVEIAGKTFPNSVQCLVMHFIRKNFPDDRHEIHGGIARAWSIFLGLSVR